ncbi:hypothetical protein THIARS_70580 [Thiomonas delicata]|uniref:Uncharacterized protein n=2 Tax=Thiomonas delicata TaxID=364030 RepID=A0A238D725_THIDL|nr:hypothetical protein THIARS_70580 [Thiomonas delicata]
MGKSVMQQATIQAINSGVSSQARIKRDVYVAQVARKSYNRMAFGITLASRHGDQSDMCEMMQFAAGLHKTGLHENVKAVFYDCKTSMCNIEISEWLSEEDEVTRAILAVAKQTIGQFQWFGTVQHAPWFPKDEDASTGGER